MSTEIVSRLRADAAPDTRAAMERVVVYHNPACGKSRGAIEILRERGVEFDAIEYLKTPPDRATLEGILAKLGGPHGELVP
jgi:arsenate reductase